MTRAKAYQKRHAKARQRRRRTTAERLQRDHAQAQQAAKVLEQALDDLALPENLAAEIAGRLRSQHKLLGKIVGIMFPPQQFPPRAPIFYVTMMSEQSADDLTSI